MTFFKYNFNSVILLLFYRMPGIMVNEGARKLQKKLLSCAFRVQGGKPTRLWVVEVKIEKHYHRFHLP